VAVNLETIHTDMGSTDFMSVKLQNIKITKSHKNIKYIILHIRIHIKINIITKSKLYAGMIGPI